MNECIKRGFKLDIFNFSARVTQAFLQSIYALYIIMSFQLLRLKFLISTATNVCLMFSQYNDNNCTTPCLIATDQIVFDLRTKCGHSPLVIDRRLSRLPVGTPSPGCPPGLWAPETQKRNDVK